MAPIGHNIHSKPQPLQPLIEGTWMPAIKGCRCRCRKLIPRDSLLEGHGAKGAAERKDPPISRIQPSLLEPNQLNFASLSQNQDQDPKPSQGLLARSESIGHHPIIASGMNEATVDGGKYELKGQIEFLSWLDPLPRRISRLQDQRSDHLRRVSSTREVSVLSCLLRGESARLGRARILHGRIELSPDDIEAARLARMRKGSLKFNPKYAHGLDFPNVLYRKMRLFSDVSLADEKESDRMHQMRIYGRG
jgi:hypothetical protein